MSGTTTLYLFSCVYMGVHAFVWMYAYVHVGVGGEYCSFAAINTMTKGNLERK